jgi:SNF2 family DNA or RNA helicase
MIPRPTQLSGAKFLADRPVALLADQPRVGKTGAAIIAADYVMAQSILIVTTASGRPVWRRGMAEWSAFRRSVQIVTPKDTLAGGTDVAIVGWQTVAMPALRSQLLKRSWDLLILDESHYAKSFDAARTCAVYGDYDGAHLHVKQSLVGRSAVKWCLTGTPLPNSPADVFPMLRALAPERLGTTWGPTDVTGYAAFRDRYCVWRPMKPGRNPYARPVPVIMGGKNEPEMKARMEGFGLRRTQADVGIGEPVYEILPLLITEAQRRKVDRDVNARAVLAAADAGATKTLEMHLGPLRRLTGEIKARAAVEAVREEFESGLDKIVLMAWHTEVIRILIEELSQFGVVGLDGSTSADNRQRAVDRFRDNPAIRVFVGQIVAAGEAIDLSAAATLWFVESSFQPAQMKQASLRVTNFGQARQVVVRVCALEGSIDDAVQTTLLRKWASIRKVQE